MINTSNINNSIISYCRRRIYVNNYKNFEESKIKIFEYIESFYNRKRIPSSINYLTPQEKEDEALKLLEKSNIA